MQARRKNAANGGIRIVLCLVGALLLAAAAIMSGGRSKDEGWIPLNAQMAATLADERSGEQKVLPDSTGSVKAGAGSQEEASGMDSPLVNQDAVEETNNAEDSIDARANDSALDASGKLDVNRATAQQLDELKGIGPSKAQAIVEEREKGGFFASVDDLQRVKGIGEKLTANLKYNVVARP